MKRANNRKEYNRGYCAGLRMAIIIALGGECSRCHEVNDPTILNVNHKHGGGTKHRKAMGTGGPMYYKAILREVARGVYDLVCANCDKRIEYLKRIHGRKTSL